MATRDLTGGKLARQTEQEDPVRLHDPAEQRFELQQESRIGVFGTRRLDELLKRRRLFAVGRYGCRLVLESKKELVHGYIQSSREAVQGLNRGNGMAMLDARNITTPHSGASLDVALGDTFPRSNVTDSLTDGHELNS